MDPLTVCHFLWDLRNFSENGGTSKSSSATEGVRYASFVISVIACALGLGGNALVIWVAFFKMKQVKAMTWFLNLAVADLVFLLCLPLRAVSLFLGKWDFGWFLCKAYNFLSNMNMYVSIFILTALSIDRCLSVAAPLWHRKVMSKKLTCLVCLMLWILSIVMSLPGFLYSDEETIDNTSQCALGFFRGNPFNVINIFLNSSTCPIELPDNGLNVRTNAVMTFNDIWRYANLDISQGKFGDLPLHRHGCQEEDFQKFIQRCINKDELQKWTMMVSFSKLLVIPLLIIGFLVPLIIITLTNIIILFQAKYSLTKRSSKLYRIVIAVVAAYFLYWTPLAVVEIVFLVAAHSMNFDLMYSMSIVLPLVASIASFHSCLNPILYVLLSQRVKGKLSETMNSVMRSLIRRSEST